MESSNKDEEEEEKEDGEENDEEENEREEENGEPIKKQRLSKKVKKERKKEAMKQKFKEKKLQKKEEKKAKRQLKIESGEIIPKNKNNESNEEIVEKRNKRKEVKESKATAWKNSLLTGQRIVIDCDYQDLMRENEINSLSQQISHSYGYMRQSSKPMRLYISSIHGHLETQLKKVSGYESWPINRSEKPYTDIFTKEELIYLSADSDNVIETLDSSKVYVIGGLVDRNRYKNLTHTRAVEKGIKTARLPIGEIMKLKSSQVLTCNHVVSLLLKYSECGDWKQAVQLVIPDRKRKREGEKEDEKDVDHDDEGVEGEGEEKVNFNVGEGKDEEDE